MTGRGAAGEAGARAVRVFVSSTFRDMHAEREELVKRVFPQLRKMCEARGLEWGEVDLRWGISDEQKAGGRLLPICLAEIERCRPYFIGLLGERYGWVPEDLPADLLAREPWLAAHRGRTSITELEILHGALNDPARSAHAFFYLRAPSYVETLPEPGRAEFREGPTPEEVALHGEAGAARMAAARAERLADLKRRIRESGLSVRHDYADPKELGRLVLEDLKGVVERLSAAAPAPDALGREAAEHESFARSRVGVYVGGEGYFTRLDQHADGEGPPLVLTGESGVGKSALLANWSARRRASRPEEFLLAHFVGATSYSADWAAMLRRVLGELRRRFRLEGEAGDGADGALRDEFAACLREVSARGRAVLVFDALDRLEDRDGAPDLAWLPPDIPPNVRLLVSTLRGRPLEELRRRGWPVLEVRPLGRAERLELITSYLARSTKTLAAPLAARIAGAEQTGNPLFLRTLLEELRVYGDHHTLARQVDHYLASETPADLFGKILARYERDYEEERPGLVGDAVSLLWAARRGLSDMELLDLLGERDVPVTRANASDTEREVLDVLRAERLEGVRRAKEPLPSAYWSPLFHALRPALISHAGLYNFSHDYLRQAAGQRYLSSDEGRRARHALLADYFEREEETYDVEVGLGGAAQPAELAREVALRARAHLERGEDEEAQRLTRFLRTTEPTCADAYVLGGLLDLRRNDRPAAVINFKTALFWDEGHTEALALLEPLLSRQGKREEVDRHTAKHADAVRRKKPPPADAPRRRAHHERRDAEGRPALTAHLESGQLLGYLRRTVEELPWQLAAAREWRRLYDLLSDLQFLAVLGSEAARPYWSQVEAQTELRAVDAYRAVLDAPERHVDYAWRVATLLRDLGHADEAAPLRDYLVEHYRRAGRHRQLAAALVSRGALLVESGDTERALESLREAEALCRKTGNKVMLHPALIDLSVVHVRRGELDAAHALLVEAEAICVELGDGRALAAALANRAHVLTLRGDREGARALDERRERLLRELGEAGGGRGREESVVLDVRDDVGKSLALHEAEERVYRASGNWRELARCLGEQAQIYAERGERQRALALYKDQEQLCRELGEKAWLQECLGRQAGQLSELNSTRYITAKYNKEPLKLYEEQERLCRELGLAGDLAVCLGRQAAMWADHDKGRAVELYREQGAVLREQGDAAALAESLKNQAYTLRWERSVEAREEALRLCEEALGLAVGCGLDKQAEELRKESGDLRRWVEEARADEAARKTVIDVSSPHPAADPDRASRLNLEYQEQLARWRALPGWKRLVTKKPEPPTGI